MIKSLIISLFLTLIIELTVSFIIGIRDKTDLAVVFWTNVITNPIVVYIANCLLLLRNDLIYNIVIFIMEVIVVIVEFLIYKKLLSYKKKSPFFISCINNVVSFFIGMIISMIIF